MGYSNDFMKMVTDMGGRPTDVEKYNKNAAIGVTPFIMEERKLNVSSVDIFSRLLMDRIIFVGDIICPETANIIQAELIYLDSEDSKTPIRMYINSPGGCVDDGLGIYDTMNYIKAPVHTTCTALSASMGALLLSSGEKGHRSALRSSHIMIHQPRISGCLKGTATEVKIFVDEMTKHKKYLAQILADNCGQPLEKVMEDCERDYWMDAFEAKDYGLIDKIHDKR